ncbi:MAG TPA: MraY family glycosyltransferase [Acidimicrobiales bacterium]|nr:MraY family glycosyltransferase [Acidimicrobiales bacterium]
MARPSSWIYLWTFLGALAGGLVLTPVARRFATRFGVVDAPDARKAHVEPVSLFGGLAIYAGAFAAAWSLAAGARPELKGFFIAGLVILVFGMQDDITPMDPWIKLLAQVAAALVLTGFGVGVQVHTDDLVNVVLTVAWVVGVLNAFNYQDNMNGLAAGLAVVSALAFFVLAVTEEQYLVAVLAAGVVGGALGFLPSNFPRARIFMGDAGSMFLGFVLAFLGIRLRFLDEPKSTAFLLPAIVLGVPLFDAALATISRIRRGVPPTTPGRDHSSHRLVKLGLPQWAAVAVLWAAQAVLGLGALAVARLGPGADTAVLVAMVAAGVAAWAFLERPSVVAALPPG